MNLYEIGDNRIKADDLKLAELIGDGILNKVVGPVYRDCPECQGTCERLTSCGTFDLCDRNEVRCVVEVGEDKT